MDLNCKKQKPGQLNSMDRFSDLPDFIVHDIISFLGSDAACRTTVLSKRWSRISATKPVLYFDSAVNLDHFDTRMQRYRKGNLRIKELSLTFSTRNVELTCKIDDWVEIAVRNQVSKFSIVSDSFDYIVPAVLFTAKSLTRLYCSKVSIPFYKAVDLSSLESLILVDVVLEEPMLAHIISSCRLLKELLVSGCTGIKNIVIPRSSLLEKLDLTETIAGGGAIVLNNSTLKEFSYVPKIILGLEKPWPIIMNRGALRNLRTLSLCNVDITDNNLSQLLCEFTLLESLEVWGCSELRSIKISSTCIKYIRLMNCFEVMDVVIDAPSLKKFKINGGLDPSVSISITNNEPGCVISLHAPPLYLDTDGFVGLRKLMTELNGRNFFKLSLYYESSEMECDVEIDEEELRNVSLGPPCDVGELMLCFSGWSLTKSAVSAFVNALFLICHPQMIYLGIYTSVRNLTVECNCKVFVPLKLDMNLFESWVSETAVCMCHVYILYSSSSRKTLMICLTLKGVFMSTREPGEVLATSFETRTS